MKIPLKPHVNDVATRWGSKYKMLARLKNLMPSTNHIFVDDRKHAHYTIGWQELRTIDSTLHGLDGFYMLTDILSGEKEVTISSALPLLRHIHKLCQTDEKDDDISTGIKAAILDYISRKIDPTDTGLLMFLRVAGVMDPRYLAVSTSSDQSTMDWINYPSIDNVKDHIMQTAPNIVAVHSDDSALSTKTSPQKKKSQDISS